MNEAENYAIRVMETEIGNVKSLRRILGKRKDDLQYQFELASSLNVFRAYMISFGRVIKKEILKGLNNQMSDATTSLEQCPI